MLGGPATIIWLRLVFFLFFFSMTDHSGWEGLARLGGPSLVERLSSGLGHK